MKIEEMSAYEVVETREVSDLKSQGYIIQHKKTKAKIMLLSNEDDNKVFYVGFRTPPSDSTGVAHILEHSVLCGSKDFPVKDPFVELAKGSLNTFLNAMTYPDKTVYPVASCNEKDFKNLMHVYLDAVFYPNIYRESNIFLQEGWHYELEHKEDPLAINGVVYNEMKGAFSSPDDVLDREVFNSLFPDTPYGFESGGDPKVIPELTYEDFLAFHGSYYHPSNSYIYLYGNMDMVERLTWLDEQYLSKFEFLSIDSEIKKQTAFKEPKMIRKEYSITEGEKEEDNTYLSYNTAVGDSLDKELYIAYQILDYALCSAPGAPIKQALLEKGIGKDIYSVYENGISQPYFSIVAKNANESDESEFVNTIETVLKELVANGIQKKALKAGLNYFEFKYKEADFGSYPKGLMYGLQALDSWLYDEFKPFLHIEANETFGSLKQKIETDYFEELLKTYLLNNQHKAIITVVPKKGLTAVMEKELDEKLATYKASLTDVELEKIIAATNALLAYQEEEDSQENMEKIPLLQREDLKKTAEPFINELREIKDQKVLFHEIFTNGVSYLKLIFSTEKISAEMLPYLSILKLVLGYVDTKNYQYGDLFNEINMITGGISSGSNLYINSKNTLEYKTTFEVRVKALYENTKSAFELLEEILFSSDFKNEKRLLEILEEQKSRMQANMTSASHTVAALRAMSYLSESAAIQENLAGVSFYRFLEDLCEHFDDKKEEVISRLSTVAGFIFRKENLLVDYTGTQEGLDIVEQELSGLCDKLYVNPIETTACIISKNQKNEAFKTSAQVQYVCRAGNYREKGLEYTGALKVLKVIMGYEYLWMNVRVKGGAYGCMSSFGKTGECYFVSYRDPNLTKTIEVYEQAAEFVRTFEADERTLTKYIIGAISDLDVPLNPMAKGSRSLSAYLSNVTFADEQRDRDELLGVTEQEINRLSEYVEAFIASDCICVVGNEDVINTNSELFEKTENLFH